nr:MAG TPA: hypothetical protein [Caudoviricetes sp.]
MFCQCGDFFSAKADSSRAFLRQSRRRYADGASDLFQRLAVEPSQTFYYLTGI